MNKICEKHSTKLDTIWKQISPWAPVFCRFTLGVVFIQTGWGKLHNLPKLIQYFTDLGIPFPHLQAPFVAAVEFLSGLGFLVGIFTRFSSFMIISIMTVAIITAKWSGFESPWDLFGSQEWDYLVLALVLFCLGSGPLALSNWCCKKCPQKQIQL